MSTEQGMAAPSVAEATEGVNAREMEKMEEDKLKAKYPAAQGLRAPGGHSAFLQKRLQKGVRSIVSSR